MIKITLIRTHQEGKAVRGEMVIPFSQRPIGRKPEYDQDITIPTLENADYIIPAGSYPLRMTYSPKFKKLLPLIDQVPDREGIRIHRGAVPEHSTGCVLVDAYGQSCLEVFFNRLKLYYDETEVFIEIA